MKFLKILLAIIVVLFVIFFVGGLMLPKSYTMSRSITINAPDSVVYNNIADYHNFLKWNPWTRLEPTAKVTITGTAGQFGHMYTWEGDKTGQGQMVIGTAQPYKTVNEELKFVKPMESLADITFNITPTAGGTKVDWIMHGDNVSMMDKWMGQMMDMMMGKDFENGLKNLKELSEKK